MAEDRSIRELIAELSRNILDHAGTAAPDEKRHAPTIRELREQAARNREDRLTRRVDDLLAPVRERARRRRLDGTWEEFMHALMCEAEDMRDDELKETARQLGDLLDWDILDRDAKVRDAMDKVDISELLDMVVKRDVNACIKWDPDLQMRIRPYIG